MDELRAISTFIRAAELGSFNRAATAQGTTPQAVSKNVRQLEQYLGVRLFHRTTRKSSLTEDGQLLLHSVRSSMEGFTSALNRVKNAAREDEGLIRISAGGTVDAFDLRSFDGFVFPVHWRVVFHSGADFPMRVR